MSPTVTDGPGGIVNVDLYQDDEGRFHYVAYEPGTVRKGVPTLCGQSTQAMRHAAWFKLGDPRGRVHYDRACHECRQLLSKEE